MRPYKGYTWNRLLKVRDSLESLKENTDDLKIWDFYDEQLALVSDEIDIRYKERVIQCTN
jgi:hypothetical protein